MNKRLTLHHGLSHLLLIPALSPGSVNFDQGNLPGNSPRHGTSAAVNRLSQPKLPAARNSILNAIVKAVGVASLAFCSLSAAAQNLSDAPIRIVTPHAPGFGFDVTLSRLTLKLSILAWRTLPSST